MYALWEIERVQSKTVDSEIAKDNVIKEKISIKSHGCKAAIFWNFISLLNCCTYSVYDNEGKIIHRSYVIHKCIKFPFLKGNDIEIGPCRTESLWRGNNIYPHVLKWIIDKELGEDDKAFMIIDENNIASQTGVKKVGFRKVCRVERTGILKIYRCIDE